MSDEETASILRAMQEQLKRIEALLQTLRPHPLIEGKKEET
jgi:hypothetical protein